MAKVTSKLQVTVPKAIADRFGLRPGDDIEFQAMGEAIRVVPRSGQKVAPLTLAARLRLFDQATARMRRKQARRVALSSGGARDRGWTRAELYERGRSR